MYSRFNNLSICIPKSKPVQENIIMGEETAPISFPERIDTTYNTYLVLKAHAFKDNSKYWPTILRPNSV